MTVEERLAALEIVLPEVPSPQAAYVPVLQSGPDVYVSGQLPMRDGKLAVTGKLGKDLGMEEGQQAARLAIINCLAALKSRLASWEDLEQIIKITGYIQSSADFYQQPQVLNGASLLLEDLFGERGRHTRVAVGVNSLPLNAACEIEMIARVKTL